MSERTAENDARVPVQDEATNCRRGPKPRGSVTWSEHAEAWEAYHRLHWQQSALTIAQRGGFGYWEMTDLLGHEPTTWRVGEVPRPRVTPPAPSREGECPDCGHVHTPAGCSGPPTPSDLWAGVPVAACDCDAAPSREGES